MMDVRGKKVLIVGLARSGRAAARWFRLRGAVVTVTDSRPPCEFAAEIPELLAQKIGVELGTHREETFRQQDLIVVSPGVPWGLPHLRMARKQGIMVLPEVEVASWFLDGTLVGITGTNGKTTTTALLGRILERSGLTTFVGGNIGVPLISAVDQSTPGSFYVVELSSFQLEGIQRLWPHVAVMLNLTPNHLDRHPSFAEYVAAKAQIFRNQTAEDYAVLNADDPTVMGLAPAIASRKVLFSRRQELPDGVFVSNGAVRYRVANLERPLFAARDILLRGAFNVENVLAATAAACVLGADFEAIRHAVAEFRGVEHRLEYVDAIRGVEFYNDSKATSVDATAKALSAFDRPVHLILGGKDKGAPYAPLRPLIEGRVRLIFLIGAAADRIAEELAGSAELVRSGDLEKAVLQAFEAAKPGEIVLLSPACASFDQFRDFEHRGRVFKEIVGHLAQRVASAKGEAPHGEIETPSSTGNDQSFELEMASSASATESKEPAPEVSPESGAGTASGSLHQEDSPLPVSTFPFSDPEAQSPTPSPRVLEPVSAYEVAAEELPALKTEAEGPTAEETLSLLDSVELRPLEVVKDEALPFEFIATASLGDEPLGRTASSTSGSSADAGSVGGKRRRGEKKRERQLPPEAPGG